MPSGDSVSTYQSTGPFRPAPVVAAPLELDAALWQALERQRAADLAAAAAPANGRWWDLPRYDRPPVDPFIEAWLARAWDAHKRSSEAWVPGHESRMHARAELASYLQRVVLPATADPKLHQLPAALVHARRSGTTAYNPETDRYVRYYDAKAEKPLLCPDDSREEGSRLYRRYAPQLAEWMDPGSGHQVHYVVLTCPHARPGLLARRMRGLITRARKVLAEFRCVTGALIVLEAPLSAARKWNVHLNVIVTTDGSFFDYERLRHRWRWQLDAQRLAGGEEDLRRAISELLKYAVQTVATKSAEKLAAHQTQAPAMTEWTAAEWLEWWDAHKRFRRTRSYGCLYKIGKPAAQSTLGFVHVGWFATYRGRLFFRSALLDSIQGDNSAPPIPPLTLEELAKCRGPPPTGPPMQQKELL
jgi:hypothetical protein